MFDEDNFNEQDDFFLDDSSDFGQQDFDNSSADFFNEPPQQEVNPQVQQSKLGYKSVGVVIAVILVILALVILCLSKIKLVKKDDTVNSTVTQQEQSVNTQQSSNQSNSNQSNTSESKTSTDTTSLVNVPDSTSLDYSSKVTSAQGVVTDLSKYLQDGQVIYCIELEISMGSSTTKVHYYCGYNVYKQVSKGDILTVEYQQVSKSCFSVCTITK